MIFNFAKFIDLLKNNDKNKFFKYCSKSILSTLKVNVE